MAPKIDPTELVGVNEIADLLGVSPFTVYSWRRRDPTFPAPVVERPRGTLWRKADVVEWSRRTGRGSAG